MPEGTKQLNELERATSLSPNALIYTEVEDETSESGFSTRSSTLELVSEELLEKMEYANLETESKTIISAINELNAKLESLKEELSE